MDKFIIGKIAAVLVLVVGLYSLSFAQGSVELQLLAHVDSYGGYNDCWGYTAPDGREYALLGVQNGTSILDITDPANVVEIDFIPSANSTWKDIKTYQHYAYAVTEAGGGLQIIDLSNLPISVTELTPYSGFSTSHNIYIDVDNAMLYAEGSGSEVVRAISLADPENPVPLSSFGVECHDIYARNNIVYVSEGNSGSIGIWDLSTPTNPTFVARINVPSPGYVHNAWLSDDGNYLMSTEETSGKTVKYWDIHNLGNASITDTYLGGSSLAHNAHIKGDYAYLSHYESGLKVLDISNPNNIIEVGYYDTYPSGEGPNFNGAWGAFPFFSSGKVLISDIQTGLYVVYFEGAADADSLDPNPPQNLVAYSDYNTPNSMLLTWDDPTNYFGGDPLMPSEFTIEIERDDAPVASVPGGSETYTDNSLVDGQLYEYKIYAKIIATDSISMEVTASWTAGGAPTPKAPTNFFVTKSGSDLIMHWTNPTQNIDDTPMDDFAGINLYEDGILKLNITRTSADTGKTDSVSYTPPTGTHQYYVSAFDSENPSHESDPSNTGYSPLSLPFFDDFPTAGAPNPDYWVNHQCEITTEGDTPPSAPYVLNLDGDPIGGGDAALLPVDLSGMSGSGIILSYWWQPQGLGDTPEAGDDSYVDFLNDQGIWVQVRHYVGMPNQPFQQEVIDIASENPGSGTTFFHAAFQFRFRNTATTGAFDDWNFDNVFLGVPTTDPIMNVSPTAISDTLLMGGTSSHQITISNNQATPSNLSYTVAESPAVSWLAVTPSSGTVTSGQSDQLSATLDATGLSAGSYSTQIVVSGNDPNNPQQSIAVNLEVVEAPVIAVSPDSVHFALQQNQIDSIPIWIHNNGGGPLQILSIEDEETGNRANWSPSYTQPQKPTVHESKGANTSGLGEMIAGEGGPDPFGYTWIDSDEPDGPAYSFTDISGTGTVCVLQPTGTFDAKDEGMATINLPFDFSFYGNYYNQLQVNTNGLITFDMSFFDNAFTNQGIPNSDDPNLIVAPFWDDLDGRAGGDIYYQQVGNRFIIQWHNWGHYPNGTPNMIFQVVLFQNSSTIRFVYENIDDQASSTFGIENVDGTVGLEIANDQTYAHNQLLTQISSGVQWLNENPAAGTIAPGDSLEVLLIADATGLQDSIYQATLVINSNDPVNGNLMAPYVTLEVGQVTDINDQSDLPKTFALNPNYPNPFNPTTTIAYQVPRQSDVRIEIYNMLGQRVRTLLNDRKEPGVYQAVWNGRNDSGVQVGSGVYLYRMVAGDYTQVRKMILMK